MSTRTLGLIVAAILVGFGGLVYATTREDDEPRRPGPTETALPTVARTPTATPTSVGDVVTTGTCAGEDALALDEDRRQEGSLEGDVSGDDLADSVHLAVDGDAAPAQCRALLVVDTRAKVFVLPIANERTSVELGQPRLVSLAEVNGKSGFEIVVDVAAGASAQFAGVYTMDGGPLAQVRAEGPFAPADSLFPYAGSVTHVDAVDCMGLGRVIASAAASVEAGTRYRVIRRTYDYTSTALLREDEDARETVTVEDPDELVEFANSPFRSCPRL